MRLLMQPVGGVESDRANLEERYYMRMKRRTASWVGAGACTLAAAIATPLFSESSFQRLLPFLFLVVIALIAIRFGNIAGVVGTFAAAVIFATFLFRPTPSLLVEDSISRSNLIWMLLIGVVISDLLEPMASQGRIRNPDKPTVRRKTGLQFRDAITP